MAALPLQLNLCMCAVVSLCTELALQIKHLLLVGLNTQEAMPHCLKSRRLQMLMAKSVDIWPLSVESCPVEPHGIYLSIPTAC